MTPPDALTLRDEVALRLLVADYGAKCAAFYDSRNLTSEAPDAGLVADAYSMADAFLAARAEGGPTK